MEARTLDYRGFRLLVTPVMSHEGMWEFGYRLLRAGQHADSDGAILRRQTVSYHSTAAAAYLAGVELAKVEVDNLLALEHAF